MKWTGRVIYSGKATGKALVSLSPISLFGGVDPESGIVVEKNHPLKGESIAGKVLIFPTGKGSTVGSYTLYRLKKNGKAPCAIINSECETITAVGCIIAEIPCVDAVNISEIPDGSWIEISDNNVLLVRE